MVGNGAPHPNGIVLTGGQLGLNGHDVTTPEPVGLVGGTIVNHSATPAALNRRPTSSTAALSGSRSAALAQTLLKGTAGTVTLSGDNTYTGLTTVRGGELLLSGSGAWNPILNAGGADIPDGKVVFDYTRASTPAQTVLGELTASYDGGLWDVGQFQRSTAASENMSARLER